MDEEETDTVRRLQVHTDIFVVAFPSSDNPNAPSWVLFYKFLIFNL